MTRFASPLVMYFFLLLFYENLKLWPSIAGYNWSPQYVPIISGLGGILYIGFRQNNFFLEYSLSYLYVFFLRCIHWCLSHFFFCAHSMHLRRGSSGAHLPPSLQELRFYFSRRCCSFPRSYSEGNNYKYANTSSFFFKDRRCVTWVSLSLRGNRSRLAIWCCC